jgi:hypothetical protein
MYTLLAKIGRAFKETDRDGEVPAKSANPLSSDMTRTAKRSTGPTIFL